MKTNRENLLFICRAAAIAAIYVVLSLLVPELSYKVIQFRFSEALCILAVFTPAAVPGMTLGCFITNLILLAYGGNIFDVIFGTLATLIGIVGVYLLRKIPYIAALPYVLSNALIIPFVLKWAYGFEDSLPAIFLSVGISELIAAWVLGTLLWFFIRSVAPKIFGNHPSGVNAKKE